MSEDEINKIFDDNRDKIKCPECGQKEFGKVKNFNLLVQSNLGNFAGDWTDNPSYLRGETCQGIYINFKNIMNSSRVKIPFGIAQIGKAFRNEISPRQYIFRKREFEQMEMQMFTAPDEDMKIYEEWKQKRWQYYINLGFREENIKWHEHENLVFYAKAAWDIEYKFPFGFKEMEGIHARGSYDLTQHTKFSEKDLSVMKEETKVKFIPHVVETSVGVDRTFLAVLTEFYREDTLNDQTRVFLKLPPKLAPVKVAVFPLLKNKPELVAKAREIFGKLKKEMVCEFDDNGNVGKRYRRQDEIGTPFCITIDFETLEGQGVTVRNRDDGTQKRIKEENILEFLREKLA